MVARGGLAIAKHGPSETRVEETVSINGPEGVAFINTEYPGRPHGPHDSGAGPASLLALVGFLGLTLLVGAADGVVTATGVHTWYLSLTQPPGTPPNWVFGPVWSALYAMVAVAAWLVWRSGASRAGERRSRPALRLWGWQLLFNAAWTPAFFGLHSPPLALAVILALVALIVATMRAFAPVSRNAALLMLPYLAWTCYASYLTAGFLYLNPHA